jgi:uncharacterized protein (DUF302 family)
LIWVNQAADKQQYVVTGGGAMYYIVESKKSFEQATADLSAAVTGGGFGILHVHDLAATLRSKGLVFEQQCRVFEVCNPLQAAKVLATDIRLNMVLPCRISVYTDGGKTMLGLIKPVAMLTALSDDPALAEIAQDVQTRTMRMVDQAR